jgi:hypothetical protein
MKHRAQLAVLAAVLLLLVIFALLPQAAGGTP